MRLVEGIGGKLLPVSPYLIKHLLVVSVFLAACNKLRLHGIYDIFLLLTHRLTERITLTTGKICQLA